MKLISSTASPFVRKVRVVLLETGLNDQVTEVPVMTTPVNTADDVKSANPLGKIPALILDDGKALYDSRVITRFLDDRANAGLYGPDRLWDLLTLEATADGILDATVSMTYEGRVRPEDMQYAPWVEAQWEKASRGIASINSGSMDLLEGPLNIGQIAVGCALGYTDFRHPNRDWRGANPELATWYAGFNERPSMAATQPA